MKNILIVENNKTLATTLSNYLQNKNYFCYTCNSIESAIQEIEAFSYDLIVLDRMLDDGDGIEVAEFIKDFNYQTKVLILSELSETTQRIKGLELGADDYLPKPFSLLELSIKINKLLHTHKITSVETLSLGPIKIIPESGQLTIGTKNKVLRKKEMQLLTCLIRHKNQIVSRKKLIDSIWANSYSVPTQATLDVYIRRIRIALDTNKDYIKTVRGFGYMAIEEEL